MLAHLSRHPMPGTEGSPKRLSVVIAVYNSEAVVGAMLDRTLAMLDRLPGGGEIVLVNDASTDGSWDVLRRRAVEDERVVAVDLKRNVGQHQALMIGLGYSRGEYAATLDDDLQNPPEEVEHLLRQADAGHDLVFGRFRVKRHGPLRVAGSKVVTWLNRWLYGLPRDLVVSNVRLIRRDVIERVLDWDSRRVYLTGLAITHANSPANAVIEHSLRDGRGTYTLWRLLRLASMIVLAHPRFPWRGSTHRQAAVRNVIGTSSVG